MSTPPNSLPDRAAAAALAGDRKAFRELWAQMSPGDKIEMEAIVRLEVIFRRQPKPAKPPEST